MLERRSAREIETSNLTAGASHHATCSCMKNRARAKDPRCPSKQRATPQVLPFSTGCATLRAWTKELTNQPASSFKAQSAGDLMAMKRHK